MDLQGNVFIKKRMYYYLTDNVRCFHLSDHFSWTLL